MSTTPTQQNERSSFENWGLYPALSSMVGKASDWVKDKYIPSTWEAKPAPELFAKTASFFSRLAEPFSKLPPRTFPTFLGPVSYVYHTVILGARNVCSLYPNPPKEMIPELKESVRLWAKENLLDDDTKALAGIFKVEARKILDAPNQWDKSYLDTVRSIMGMGISIGIIALSTRYLLSSRYGLGLGLWAAGQYSQFPPFFSIVPHVEYIIGGLFSLCIPSLDISYLSTFAKVYGAGWILYKVSRMEQRVADGSSGDKATYPLIDGRIKAIITNAEGKSFGDEEIGDLKTALQSISSQKEVGAFPRKESIPISTPEILSFVKRGISACASVIKSRSLRNIVPATPPEFAHYNQAWTNSPKKFKLSDGDYIERLETLQGDWDTFIGTLELSGQENSLERMISAIVISEATVYREEYYCRVKNLRAFKENRLLAETSGNYRTAVLNLKNACDVLHTNCTNSKITMPENINETMGKMQTIIDGNTKLRNRYSPPPVEAEPTTPVASSSTERRTVETPETPSE